jgi:hypothetical protein
VKIRELRVAIAIFGSMQDLAFGYGPPGACFFVLTTGGRTLIGTPQKTGVQGTSYYDRGPYAARICRSVSSRDR